MIVRAVPAVSRAIAILRLLGRARAPMGMKAIAEALDLVPSTALHILRVLVAEELVRVDAGKQYTLGMGTLALARASLESDGFPAAVQPHLDALSKRYGVTAIGLELPNLTHMIVVALSRNQSPVRLHVDVGSRFPTLISATGRCIAAFGGHAPAEIEKRFKALRWDNAPGWDAWRREVEVARRQGYSIDRNAYIAGVTIVSVPILNEASAMTRGIAAVGITGQLDRAKSVELALEMQKAARSVEGFEQPRAEVGARHQ
jgi:DNA-binding IclR family transcriptional regulator